MEDPLLKEHSLGLKGLLQVYPFRTLISGKTFWVSLVLTFVFSTIFQVTLGDTFSALIHLVDLVLSVYPNLLGFNLGAYALIVGFGNLEIMKAMTQKPQGEAVSLYQTISAVFAMGILAQAATLIFAFFVHLLAQIDFQKLGVSSIWRAHFWIPNCVMLIALGFLLFYSVLLLPKVVLYVFNFSQLVHLHLVLDRERKSPGVPPE